MDLGVEPAPIEVRGLPRRASIEVTDLPIPKADSKRPRKKSAQPVFPMYPKPLKQYLWHTCMGRRCRYLWVPSRFPVRRCLQEITRKKLLAQVIPRDVRRGIREAHDQLCDYNDRFCYYD